MLSLPIRDFQANAAKPGSVDATQDSPLPPRCSLPNAVKKTKSHHPSSCIFCPTLSNPIHHHEGEKDNIYAFLFTTQVSRSTLVTTATGFDSALLPSLFSVTTAALFHSRNLLSVDSGVSSVISTNLRFLPFSLASPPAISRGSVTTSSRRPKSNMTSLTGLLADARPEDT